MDVVATAIESLKVAIPAGASFTRAEQIHVTLQFLGELEAAEIARAIAVAEQIDTKVFTVTIFGNGAFPDLASPRVLFLGVRQGEPLVALAERLGSALAEEGFAIDERAYHPHLTLARVRSGAMADAAHAIARLEVEPLPIPVERFALYESRGGEYLRVADFALRRG